MSWNWQTGSCYHFLLIHRCTITLCQTNIQKSDKKACISSLFMEHKNMSLDYNMKNREKVMQKLY